MSDTETLTRTASDGGRKMMKTTIRRLLWNCSFMDPGPEASHALIIQSRTSCFFFLINFFKPGGLWSRVACSVVLVSATSAESTICDHIPLFWISFPLDHHRALS